MERLLDYFVPEKYILDLSIDKFKKTIEGKVRVFGESKGEIVKFHAVGLSVDEVLVNGKKTDFKVEKGVLTLSKVPRSDLGVEIRYHGGLNENMQGAYLSKYEYRGETEVIVATQFESHYAREAFPCVDEPEAKAVFEVSITVPEKSEDIILGNMPVKTVVKNTTVFEPTPRMSTYLLAWVIGKFHGKTVKNKHGVEITTYAALNQDLDSVGFANKIAAKSLEFYDDNFKISYPLKKLDQVALPDFEAGAMENWGLVTYRESMLLVGKSATLGAKKSVALTVAHELSHQWFGDLVTMKWWDDLWLNESFASVMEYYAVDAIHPEYKIFESFFTSDCCAALLRDAHSGVQSVHQDVKTPEEISTLFDGAIVYAKGARLMLMTIRLMGWENFCKGIAEYFEKYKYGNTTGDDLWDSLKPYASFDPKKLMHAFIDKPGYPVITNEGENFEKFSQKKFSLDGGKMEKESWPIPEVMEDMSGHYVLNLSEGEFRERLERFSELGLEEKLRLLIDRDLIAQSGLQSAASLVPLAMEFKNEDAPAVWNKVASLIANLKVYFDSESPEEKMLKKYTLKLVDKKLKEIGIRTREDDDEDMIRLRANLLGLDYFAEDEKRFRELAGMYESDAKKMDPEIREDILCAKIYLEPKMVDEYLENYKNIADPDIRFDYLIAATLVRDEEQLQKVVNLLGNYEVVKPQDQLHLFISLYRNPKSKAQTFEWMIKNWDSIKETGGEKTLNDYPMLTARLARTEEELDKYLKFFGPMRDDPILSRAIIIGENEIKARIKMIKKYRKAVMSELEKYI
ncbi:M1 family metallopeptidase [Candidatus Saccharibacteria bacterium]|nr:M1 family metallopeptidase [Candidatus Saccharibacteria bacterium]